MDLNYIQVLLSSFASLMTLNARVLCKSTFVSIISAGAVNRNYPFFLNVLFN